MGFREAARAKTSERKIKRDEDGMRLREKEREKRMVNKEQGPILRGCIERKEKGLKKERKRR